MLCREKGLAILAYLAGLFFKTKNMNDEEAQSLIHLIPRDVLMKSLNITEEDMAKQSGAFRNFGLIVPQDNEPAVIIKFEPKEEK